MNKPLLRVVVIPSEYFSRSEAISIRFRRERYLGKAREGESLVWKDLIVESPSPNYEPGIRIVNAAVSRALRLTDSFPEHRIDYSQSFDGKVAIKVDPLGESRRSLALNDEKAFGREPIPHWRGFKWGDSY